MTTITIPQLPTIPNANISGSSLLAIVDTTGVPQTDKVTVGNLANFVLTEAGNLLENAFLSTYSQSVTNAAQPNITSVGTLSVNTLKISGGSSGQLLRTDGAGNLSWVTGSGGGSTGNIGFDDTTMYSLDGLSVDNSDLSHGSTAGLFVPANGDDAEILLNNTYGNVTLQAGVSSNPTATWIFDNTGNFSTTGNLVGPSDANFVIYSNGGIHNFTFGDDGTFYAPDNVVLGGTSIAIGPGADEIVAQLTNAVLVASSDLDAYIQAVINNVSDNGSADWVALGHLGNNDYGWSDMGFNSSGFGDPDYTLTGQGDGYFIVQTYASGQAPGGRGGNLIIATGDQGTSNDIIFGTGGFLTVNEFARISDANNALEFYDGGNITGANVISANTFNGVLANGNSNVQIASFNGNVEINATTVSEPVVSIDSVFAGSAPTGYLPGTFTNQPTSGGNGIGLTVNYTCVTINQAVSSVSISNPGSGYQNGDVVSIDGGNGPGFSATVTLNVTNTPKWVFDTTGNLTFPNGGVILDIFGFAPGLSTFVGDANGISLGTSSGNDITITPADGASIFSNNYQWLFGTDGVLTLPNADATGFGNIYFEENSSTITFGLDDNTVSRTYSFGFDSMTIPGDINLPLVAKLNSGGIGVTNAAEFGTEVTVDGSNIINGSQIYMGAGTAESRAIVNSTGNSLMYLGVENPGFAGMVGIDPGVTSAYAIQVGSNNQIEIGAVVGPITTTEYVAGLGVLNATGNINGIFANANVTVIGAGDIGWKFSSDGNLTIPGNIIVDTAGTANISSDSSININSNGNIWTFSSTGSLTTPVVVFANLPAATTPGLRAFISDANLVSIGNFGAQVTGGGGNYVPVFSDGATWCIG